MAGWLSSKLKVAEQLLQQIDQQAAQSLKKSDHETPLSFTSSEEKSKDYSQSFLKTEKNKFPKSAVVTTPEGHLLSTKTKGQQPLSNLRRVSGVSNDQPTTKKMDIDRKKSGTMNVGLASSADEALGKSLKEDWTELLASPVIIGNSSVSRTSSVGSSDLGISSVRGLPSKGPFYSGRGQTIGASLAPSTVHRALNQQPEHLSMMSSPLQSQPDDKFILNSETGNRKAHKESVKRYSNLNENNDQTGNFEVQDLILEDAESSTEEGQSSNLHLNQVDTESCLSTAELRIDESVQCEGEISIQPKADFKKKQHENPGALDTHLSNLERLELKGSTLVEGADFGQVDLENTFTKESMGHVIVPCSDQETFESKGEHLVHRDVSKASSLDKISGIETDGIGRDKTSFEMTVMQVRDIAESVEHDKAFEREVHDDGILRENGSGSELRSSRGQDAPMGLEQEHEVNFEIESDSDADSDYVENLQRLTAKKSKLVELKVAELAAAETAKEYLRKHEELVAKLEEERKSLEKVLAERQEKQAKEAKDLQSGMLELSEELELEKRRHANTRMDSLAKEAKLEAENAQLARALAAAQRNLDKQVSHLIQIRSKVDAQKVAKADLERKIAKLNSWISQQQMPQAGEASESVFDHGALAEEKLEILSEIDRCRVQIKDLEGKVANAKNVIQAPTDVEIELEHRLNQLTEHLIQKQSQVEELSTEKATLLFRLETLSNSLRDERSPMASQSTKRNKGSSFSWATIDEDLEHGASNLNGFKNQALPFDINDSHGNIFPKALNGRDISSHFYRHVHSLFLGGTRILRIHKLVRAVVGLYLLALHCWVLFVIMMHSNSSRKGAAVAHSTPVLSLPDSVGFLNASKI